MKLPESWVEARLDAVCQLNPRLGLDERPDDSTEITFVPMSAVDDKLGAVTAPETRTYSEVAKGYTYFKNGDVLLAKVTPCMENGKAAIADSLKNGLGFGSTEFHVLRPTCVVMPEYVFHFIRQPAFRDRAASAFVGTGGLQRVPPEFLSRVKLPLPTLPEQQRIVNVLQQAAEVSDSQTQRHKSLDSILMAELDRLILKIDEAEWVRLDNLVETRYGTSVSADESGEHGLPVLRIPNVVGGEVDMGDMKFVSLSDAEIDRLRLTTSDVLIVRSNGNPDYVGRSAPITKDLAHWTLVYASYLIRLRANTDRLLPEYLSAFLNSPFGRAAMRNAIRTTAGQSNLSGENLLKVRIPLPSMPDQCRFRNVWSEVRQLRQLLRESESKRNELIQHLTVQALSGELTTEWRDQHREEITAAAQNRANLLRERGTRIKIRPSNTVLQASPASVTQLPARAWLLSELSDFQRQVFDAFLAYPDQPLLAEDPDVFARFCESEALNEKLAAFPPTSPNHLRRTLSQLAALGLIAKVTLPKTNTNTGEQEFLTAFRPLRPGEQTRAADVAMLRRSLDASSGQAGEEADA